jgi:hypothetical protein
MGIPGSRTLESLSELRALSLRRRNSVARFKYRIGRNRLNLIPHHGFLPKKSGEFPAIIEAPIFRLFSLLFA